MSLLGRLFPDTLFPRKLSDAAERRLRLAQARAEEAVLETHVRNALLYVDTLAGELPFDRAIETYIRMLGIPEPLASTVATRTLVVLGDDVVPERTSPLGEHMVGDDVLPMVRIAAAGDGSARRR
jgi:hypothetical protein